MLNYMQVALAPMKRRRVVQTEVDPETHARLSDVAEQRRIPLKAVVNEALASYLRREGEDWKDDPILEMIGSVRLGRSDWSRRKDWRP